MAVTQKKPEEQYKPEETVQNNQQQTQEQAPAYQQSQPAQQAEQVIQQNQAQNQQGYTSKYGPQMESIMQQIQNPGQFKYDFNGDELFKYYADLYTQKGKQASMDAMGQAAALTGGYGNSYAQQAGNQAYDQYLLSLYDKGMDMRDRAYQQHQDQQADLYNQYNMLANADSADYSKYADTRDYAAQYVMNMLAKGQMPSDDLLKAAGISAADAQKLMTQVSSGGTGSSKTYYTDLMGNYYEIKDGKYTGIDPDKVPNNAKVDTTRGMNILMQNASNTVDNILSIFRKKND